MNKYYLITFIGNENNTECVTDITNDPDFSLPHPTWGICRPNVRRWKSLVGSTLIFLGYFKEQNRYYIKGWFKVDSSITFLDALTRFPNRRNVIIRKSDFILNNNESWKSKKIKKLIDEKYNGVAPSFLREIQFNGNKYVQNEMDDHEIDNWKCKRIFYCKGDQLHTCLENGNCVKENVFPDEKGYIVGSSDYVDLGTKWIPWREICPQSYVGKDLKTPKKQHNVKGIALSDFNEIKSNVIKFEQNR